MAIRCVLQLFEIMFKLHLSPNFLGYHWGKISASIITLLHVYLVHHSSRWIVFSPYRYCDWLRLFSLWHGVNISSINLIKIVVSMVITIQEAGMIKPISLMDPAVNVESAIKSGLEVCSCQSLSWGDHKGHATWPKPIADSGLSTWSIRLSGLACRM